MSTNRTKKTKKHEFRACKEVKNIKRRAKAADLRWKDRKRVREREVDNVYPAVQDNPLIGKCFCVSSGFLSNVYFTALSLTCAKI